jgi:tRNA A-37 threonylcarbamoyl transferase component Bud32/tetratricopeptide (TPR) repeat protein
MNTTEHATSLAALRGGQDEAVGQTLGRYKLLEKVGEGGCGIVYVAEQTEPVRRRVALKVIKLGMDTKAVVARFEAERQALAMMDHPNIAKVLDAGATEMGRPFFVMELVRGIKITEYCDQHHLATKERLELFVKVCQAIQHAHQKGIIHRDIKPSNILVTLHDGAPVPKVIDFGIAKATEGRLTDATVYTQLHQFIGTPAYMSPEQAEMSGLDVDTRSDIYSLGVLLYELLTGRTPFDPTELMSQGLDVMRRTIREKEPVRPSTKVATLQAEEQSTTAECRGAEALKLISLLRGDLDWIVMKCLEKDRTRRYETANGLAFDLKRHLNNEPVLARPPSTAYRLQKALQRHKVAAMAAMAVILVVILGVAGITLALLKARHAETLSMQSRNDAENLANFMLEDLYAELEPSGQLETITRLARKAVAYYDGLSTALRTPETERNWLAARARLALLLASQGDFEKAIATAEKVQGDLERRRQQGDQSDSTILSLGMVGQAFGLCYLRREELTSMVAALEKAADALRPLAHSPGGSQRVKLQYADILNDLSHFLPPERGTAICEEALQILEGIGALDWSNLSAASAWADVADSKARESLPLGRIEEAERLEKEVQRVAEGVVSRRPGDLRARSDFTMAPDMFSLIAARRYRESDALEWQLKGRQSCEDYIRYNPSALEGWISLYDAHYTIAALLFRAGRVGEALRDARAAAEKAASTPGLGFSRVGPLWPAIARWEAQREDREAAERALREARRSYEASWTLNRTPEPVKQPDQLVLEDAERQVRLDFGENAAVLDGVKAELPRLQNLRENASTYDTTGRLLFCQRNALCEASCAALRLGRFAEAEETARLLSSLPVSGGGGARLYRRCIDQPMEGPWGPVLLAEAIARQGRSEEALKILQPAIVQYREMLIQGATHVSFRQHFARALYVQSLAQGANGEGQAGREAELEEAQRLLQGLSDEARQLHDSKELLGWITEAQKRPPTSTGQARQ